MKLFELRDLVRARTRDTVAPYFATDEEIDANLNEAQREACVRALLIEDEITLDIHGTVIERLDDPADTSDDGPVDDAEDDDTVAGPIAIAVDVNEAPADATAAAPAA